MESIDTELSSLVDEKHSHDLEAAENYVRSIASTLLQHVCIVFHSKEVDVHHKRLDEEESHHHHKNMPHQALLVGDSRLNFNSIRIILFFFVENFSLLQFKLDFFPSFWFINIMRLEELVLLLIIEWSWVSSFEEVREV